MLPMGTIVTALMLVGVLFVNRLPLLGFAQRQLQVRPPGLLQRLSQCVGVLVFAGGAWNVFWYAFRNITAFWGQAALVSGVLMMITGLVLINPARLPAWIQHLRPLTTAGLFACGLFYAWTIYSL